jgi:hypothetical protein
LCLLVVIDMLPGTVPARPIGPKPIDLWLAEQPGDLVVAYLPANESDIMYPAMFGSLFHAKHMPAFMHRNHYSPAYRDFVARATGFPSPQSIQQLRTLDLDYLLLVPRFYDGETIPGVRTTRGSRATADEIEAIVGYPIEPIPDWQTIEAQVRASPELSIVDEIGDVVVVEFR